LFCSVYRQTWLRSNFSAVLRILAWAFSRSLRRAMTVRRLRAGVAPSKTKTGLVRRYKSLQIRRKKPSKWAFRTISPLSSLIAFMNWTSHILASKIKIKIKIKWNGYVARVFEERRRVVYRWLISCRLEFLRILDGRREPASPTDLGLPFCCSSFLQLQFQLLVIMMNHNRLIAANTENRSFLLVARTILNTYYHFGVATSLSFSVNVSLH